MAFFFRITHRLCVQGNEWEEAFGAALPLLHTVEQKWFRDIFPLMEIQRKI